MAAMKVFHIITRLDWGGSAQNTMLTVLGHDVSRFCPIVVAGPVGSWTAQGGDHATQANCARLDAAGIQWRLLSTLTREVSLVKDLRTLWALFMLFRQERPAIVHTHTSKAGVVGRLAAWLAGVPIVVHTPHGHVFYGHFGNVLSWVFKIIERLFARGTSKIIALTEAEKHEHLQCHVGRADQFRSVFSGIDVTQYRAASVARQNSPHRFGCSVNAMVVGSVGWLTSIKGHQYLIEAIAKLKPRYPQLHCLIVGSGPLREELSKLAAGHSVASAVHFLGHMEDIPSCLAAMDAFVLPSLNEGMGRALIEAMAAGLPVIASNVGGVPAIVQDGQTGLLVPPGNSDALAEALERYLQSPEWANMIGAAAQEYISTRFDVSSMVRGVESVYDEALIEHAKVGAAKHVIT
ncbi:MAG: glycosyl transferase [Nitrospirales bacterium]|nr:MAG: glycosyl transferase [Nitrospirales bacterium]